MSNSTTQNEGGAFKAFLKLTPIILLAYMIIDVIEIGSFRIVGMGFDVLIAAPLAALWAAIMAYATERITPTECIDIGVENVKQIQLVFFILMMAYAMAGAFMETGVGASLVLLCLKLGLTAKTVAPVGLLVTALLSVATGTSWGTFAACAPIFLWMSDIVGGDMILTVGAIAGGACFGDNIGLISDTTVVSSGIQEVEVIDRIRHQGVWSVLCLIVGMIVFYIASLGLSSESVSGAEAIAGIPPEMLDILEAERPDALSLLLQIESGVPMYLVIPFVLVIAVAIMGTPTLMVLFIGIVTSLIFGLIAGEVEGIIPFLEDIVQAGFADAGSWVIVMMMWISFFGGIMNEMKAFEPISRGILKLVNSVKGLMFANAVLSLIGNALLADEMAQIVTVGPIIKDLLEENVEGSEEAMYTLHLRNATYSDALGVFGSQLIPWHVYISYYIGMAATVYPLMEFGPMDIIGKNYLAMIAVASILILTITGADRFIPLFALPKEPEECRFIKENKTAAE